MLPCGAAPCITAPQPPPDPEHRDTSTIPSQPVELGLVASLARPGGNVTGLAWSVNLEFIGKGVELLKETVPTVRRVAVLANPANPGNVLAVRDVKAATRSSGVQLQLLEARGPGGSQTSRQRTGCRRCMG
ncbi:MAG TPA: ABC transporter substrate binding protein [Methylomirabilota bacterium]|nr:ABC transporter substrate binding protein [Methylomirabilota bacterium]